MLNFNILMPWERKRIKEAVTEEVEKRFEKKVKSLKFHHIGDPQVYLFVVFEDETEKYITTNPRNIKITLTISDCEF